MFPNKILDHFNNPRNCGEIQQPNGIGYEALQNLGIAIKITVQVENGIIKDVKFKTAGCVTAIASTSILTELVKGSLMEEAVLISPTDISNSLGGIPKEKMHCSILAVKALHKALMDYRVSRIRGSITLQELECCKN
jgi:nitrogen fixation NifU-like protein